MGRVILLAAILLAGSSRGSEIPVREFFKNPDTCDYRLSPSGRQIAFLKPSGKSHRLNIFIKSTAGGKAKPVTFEDHRNVAQYYFWKGEDHLLYFVDLLDGRGGWHLCCVDLKKKDAPPRDVTPCAFTGVVIDELSKIPNKILVERIGSSGAADAYELDILGGQTQLVATNPGDVQQWITDRYGKIRAATAGDYIDLCLLARENETDEFRTILTTNFRESIAPKPYNFDQDEVRSRFQAVGEGQALLGLTVRDIKREVIYLVSMKNGDKAALVTVDPGKNGEMSEVYANPDFDVSGMEASRRGGVVSATFSTWRNERHLLDDSTKRIYARLERYFPKDDLQITAYDDAEAQLVVQRTSDQNPGEFYLFKPQTGYLKKLGEVAPQLKGALVPIKPICFMSRDNRAIHGYLTLPRGRRKNVPLIVVPHGGPWIRNVWGFNRENREIQFFANRGYAVLQLNFRASKGYGRNFWEAGFQQWGQAMQNDVTDGVLWAIDQKIADPKRVAIVGESYGGYAALAGIAFTRDLPYAYAAAIDRAGISDLVALLQTYRRNPQLRVTVGDPEQDAGLLRCFSPALNPFAIKTPLLIAHGVNDPTVPPEQSCEIYNALKEQGADVEPILWVPSEGHIFQNEESLFAYYEAVDAFLKKHLR